MTRGAAFVWTVAMLAGNVWTISTVCWSRPYAKRRRAQRFGSISIALTLLWALFTTMLLISWYVIRRMVSNMYVLQSSLQWQAWHDTLTRLYNRGALLEKARPLAKLCQTHQHPFSVIQVDLDHFKAINDRFGHQAGDRVSSHAAGLISSSLRAQDVAGQVGGEEFCVILPGASLTEAAEVAERIRLKLNERDVDRQEYDDTHQCLAGGKQQRGNR